MTPLDTARLRLQVSTKDVGGMQTIKSMLKEEGIRSLYKGMAAPVVAQVGFCKLFSADAMLCESLAMLTFCFET